MRMWKPLTACLVPILVLLLVVQVTAVYAPEECNVDKKICCFSFAAALR